MAWPIVGGAMAEKVVLGKKQAEQTSKQRPWAAPASAPALASLDDQLRWSHVSWDEPFPS